MKFCTECGTKAEFDEQKFCKICGHKFPEVTVTPSAPQEPTTVILPGAQSQPVIPDADTTIGTQFPPIVPNDGAAAYTPVRPTASDNEATVFTPVQPTAPDDGATIYTPVQPTAPGDEATVYTPVQSAASEDNASMYIPVQPVAPESDETVRAFVQPQTAEDNVTMRADTFFEPSADAVPPMDEVPAEPSQKKKKKKFPVILIVLLVVVLLAALAVGGLFVWKKLGMSKNVTIGDTSYSIEETTSLSVKEPSSEDWNNLCALPNLTSLTVTGNGSAELNENKLHKLLALNKLEELSVDGMLFPDGIGELADMESLTTLKLTNCQLTGDQCSGLDGLRSLRKLDLSNNALSDISFLQELPKLERLDISGNQITDYSPLSSLTSLTSLSVDQCQVQALSALPDLSDLTVDGKSIDDVATYLADQKSAADLYDSIIGWFESKDFSTLNVVLKQLTDEGALGDTALSYVNGWLMNSSSVWDTIRAALPADSKQLVMDSTGLYYGQLKDGKRSGEGIQMFANNYSVYNGSWDNDLPNGTGTYRKTLSDGTVVEISGSYANGYENGTMTFSTGKQSGTYTASNGTRTTVKKISDTQYAFVQFDTTYWYDASPDGHGVAVDQIAYQEEKSVEIRPEPQAASAPASSGSSGSSGKKSTSSGSSSAGASTPAPSTPAPAASTPAPAPSTPAPSSSSSSSSSGMSEEDALRLVLGGLTIAKSIYDNF